MKKEEKFIEIIQPDDWHLHLRDNEILKDILPYTTRVFARAIVMPNLEEPVRNLKLALAYRERILNALASTASFEPLMTLYLTQETSKKEIEEAKENKHVHGVKLYPANVTTNSRYGVQDILKLYPLFEKMEKISLPLLIHAEVNDSTIDVFDKEKIFIETYFKDIVKNFPNLKIIFEHITTKEGIQFVEEANENLGATITVHHLLWNRNIIFKNGIRPHYYCLPLLKKEDDRLALLQAISKKQKKFFLGTDSAPHLKNQKESSCGCAGIFSAPYALELYTQVFEEIGALDFLEDFTSLNGANFYGLPINKKKITLVKEKVKIPESYPCAEKEIIPLEAGTYATWSIKG